MKTVPVFPAFSASRLAARPFPSGVTSPLPVMKTFRDISVSMPFSAYFKIQFIFSSGNILHLRRFVNPGNSGKLDFVQKNCHF
jgi:hypothetical protein